MSFIYICIHIPKNNIEVLSSRKYDGKKVDIWSLGIILYVMLVGQVPFKSRHVKILYESIVNKEYNIPDYVPNGNKFI